MRFNRNIYLRLEQIAFFIPDLGGRRFEGDTVEYQFQIPLQDSIPVDDPDLKNKIYNMFFKALSRENLHNYTFLQNFMRIDDFEYLFFVVCLVIYKRLSFLFIPYIEGNQTLEESNTNDSWDYSEHFYKSIPPDAFTRDMIEENSYGMFHSVKMACDFYYKFYSSYCLYWHSSDIKTHESEIPMLVRTKEIISRFLCSFPLKPYKELKEDLSYLSDLLYIRSSTKKDVVSNKLQKDHYWSAYKETLDNEIIDNCIDIAEKLSGESLIPISKLLFEENPDLVGEVEKKRRNKISETQKKRLEEREVQVQKHVKNVLKKCRSRNISKTEACDKYFKENIAELRECGINSQGTLRNHCVPTKPNKQRSAFFNRTYTKPYYSDDFQKEVIEISEKIKESGG